MSEERWSVEYRTGPAPRAGTTTARARAAKAATGPSSDWYRDMGGRRVFYADRDEALARAVTLRKTRPYVRLRHDITDYEALP